jgi:DNA polymerase III alpha subunit
VSPKTILKSSQIQLLEDVGAFDEYAPRDISLRERQKLEKDILSIILTEESQVIFDRNQEEIAQCDSYSDLEEKGRAKLPGVITQIKPTITKDRGEEMGIITMEFGGEKISYAAFPESWRRYQFMFKEQACLIATLQTNPRGVSFVKGKSLK